MPTVREIHEVFTPMSPAVHAFSGRRYEPALEAALTVPGRQVVVHGPTGAGKTTLVVHTVRRLGLRSELTECRRSETRIDPEAAARTLIERDLVWVLEDAHKLPPSVQRGVVQVMRACADHDGPARVVALATAGALDGDGILGDALTRLAVEPMTPSELDGLVVAGAEALNLDIPLWMRAAIVAHGGGHPAICHQFALNLCLEAGVFRRAAERTTIPDDAFARARAATPTTLI